MHATDATVAVRSDIVLPSVIALGESVCMLMAVSIEKLSARPQNFLLVMMAARSLNKCVAEAQGWAAVRILVPSVYVSLSISQCIPREFQA